MADQAPLAGVRLVCVAINLPGPAAGARFTELGATVTKVEPPSGDPLGAVSPELYGRLTDGQTVLRLDLKHEDGRLEAVSYTHLTLPTILLV